MRINFNASALAKLTARFSFLSASEPNHSPTSSPIPVPSALDKLFPLSGRARHLLDRGQAFGFFAQHIDTVTNIHTDKFFLRDIGVIINGEHEFDCATISIHGVSEADRKKNGYPSVSLQIFKDKNSDSYFIGSMKDDSFASTTYALNDADLYWEIFKWSKSCATMYPSKRMALIDTMSDKPSPGKYSPARVAQAFLTELKAYINRSFC